MRSILLITFMVISTTCLAQVHLGLFGGISNYYGDLNDRLFYRPHPAAGISVNLEASDRLTIRTAFTMGKIEGADKYSGSEQRATTRNLSFFSNISELSIVGELTAFNLYHIRWSPYVFAGLAIYHFDPYTYDEGNNKVYLKPLSTEGQGLPEYPEKRPYATTDLSIPYGAGIKYNVSDRLRIGAEVGLRKTFTDYLDDVSTTYADGNVLRSRIGPTAEALSYRGDEAGGSPAYPAKGTERGNSLKKDGYYFTGLHLTYRLFSRNRSSGKYNAACPRVPQ